MSEIHCWLLERLPIFGYNGATNLWLGEDRMLTAVSTEAMRFASKEEAIRYLLTNKVRDMYKPTEHIFL